MNYHSKIEAYAAKINDDIAVILRSRDTRSNLIMIARKWFCGKELQSVKHDLIKDGIVQKIEMRAVREAEPYDMMLIIKKQEGNATAMGFGIAASTGCNPLKNLRVNMEDSVGWINDGTQLLLPIKVTLKEEIHTENL